MPVACIAALPWKSFVQVHEPVQPGLQRRRVAAQLRCRRRGSSSPAAASSAPARRPASSRAAPPPPSAGRRGGSASRSGGAAPSPARPYRPRGSPRTGTMPSSMSRADSQGKRLLDSAVSGSASRTSCLRIVARFGPASAKTPHCVVTSWTSTQSPTGGHEVLDRLLQVVGVVGRARPRPRRGSSRARPAGRWCIRCAPCRRRSARRSG